MSVVTIEQPKKDILSYASKIWSTADILRSNVTTKESLYPLYMMPFFSLVLIESRTIRAYNEIKDISDEKERYEELKDIIKYYNPVLIEEGLTLAKICQNDLTFEREFMRYLNGYPEEVKNLLGVNNGSDDDNLNIMSKIKSLKDKKVLLGWIAIWADIDLTPYDNSEVTTLEEHIKRQWADMSAETAGQQYTPSDIIALISELTKRCNPDLDGIIRIYDPTCGGGNMLFGVEDKFKELARNKGIAITTKTYGQELEGSLYALAKIESYFRMASYIEKGNTLTDDKFATEKMDFVVANPPYGVDWKEYKKAIEADTTGRFDAGKPSTSDGQLLFLQHIVDKLNDNNGQAFVVLNGSPMFSGDAGSGESNIRKWLLDKDYVKALIQLPTGEFFNTGISTYIWCLSKNKSAKMKDKILFINAEDKFEKLKKSKGQKNKEIDEANRNIIANIFENNLETDMSVIKSKYDFYFNKQIVKVLNKDDEYGSLTEKVVVEIDDLESLPYLRARNFEDLKDKADYISNYFNEMFNQENESVFTFKDNKGDVFKYDCESHLLEINEEIVGYAEPSLKIKHTPEKITKKGIQEEKVNIDLSFIPSWYKDEEKIPYNNIDNDKEILEFMKKWVSEDSDDYQLLDNTVGVEINFNDIFKKTIKIKNIIDILKEIEDLEDE